MPSIDLINVYKRWEADPAVKDLSLRIEDGEFVVFLGPSGCGKTTTMRLIAGLEEISDGEIYIDDKLMNDVDPGKRKISMVFQNYALFPHMSVRKNLAYPLKVAKIPKDEHDERIQAVAKMIQLENLLDRKPAQLSGGQRQRVAFGRAIIKKPQVFLMDEPLSNMDAILRQSMRAELKNLHHKLGITTIYVTHDQVEAMTLATRIAVMKGGRLHQFDKPEIIFNEPATSFVAGFIGAPAMNLIEGEIQNGVFRSKLFNFQVNTDFSGPITLGLRPFDLQLCEADASFGQGQIYSTEMTGEHLLLTIVNNSEQVILRTDLGHSFDIEQSVQFRFDLDRCYFFDSTTGDRKHI